MLPNVFVGMQHGRLTVVRDLGKSKGHKLFECKCECGNIATLRSSHFYPSRVFCSRECPLLADKRTKVSIGQRFGRWTVTEFSGHENVGGRPRKTWLCKCDCGAEKSVPSDPLLNGESSSCGCYNRQVITRHHSPEAKLAAKRESSRVNARKNPARRKANKIKYEQNRDGATPKWLTADHWREMDAFYEKARNLSVATGIRHEVDHIVPLQGKLVCGFHVPWNLQILTQAQNVSKSNRYADLSCE